LNNLQNGSVTLESARTISLVQDRDCYRYRRTIKRCMSVYKDRCDVDKIMPRSRWRN